MQVRVIPLLPVRPALDGLLRLFEDTPEIDGLRNLLGHTRDYPRSIATVLAFSYW